MKEADQPTTALGLSAFDSLRAEDEPWLEDCFVPPVNFDLIAGARSALVFGEDASGKTALFRMLLDRLTRSTRVGVLPSGLIVNWSPPSPPPGLSGSPVADLLLSHILGQCAAQLLVHLATWPAPFLAAPPDTQRTLAWFIQHYRAADAKARIAAQQAVAHESADSDLASLLGGGISEHWLSGQRPAIIINELTKALHEIGLDTVYVLLSPDAVDDSEPMQDGLCAFLSSPTLFENPNFLYKMILPIRLKTPLAKAGAAIRRRIDVHTLSWIAEDLIEIVLRRTALAAGQAVSELEQICLDPSLVRWLERTGGIYPRGWLESISPLVARYLRKGQAISTKEWRTIRAQDPPSLHFDKQTKTVTVGWYRIADLPDVPLALLSFLWEHRGRVCTRRELYYRAYLPTSYPNTPLAEIHDFAKDYEHTLDTAINRLRDRIEPGPRPPIYIVTARGKGYKLDHWW